MWIRHAAGDEVLMYTSTITSITNGTITEYLVPLTITASSTILTTDRYVCRLYGRKTGGGSAVITMYSDGQVRASRIDTTFKGAIQSATSLGFNVVNGEAFTVFRGYPVYISGSSGSTPKIGLADNTDSAKTRVVGIMKDDCVAGGACVVIRAGLVTGINTSVVGSSVNAHGQTWAGGDLLFLDAHGDLTNVRPTSGRSVKVAYCLMGNSASDSLMSYPFENPVWVTAASGESVILRTGDIGGATAVSIRDYNNIGVATITSNGNMVVKYGITASTLTGTLQTAIPAAMVDLSTVTTALSGKQASFVGISSTCAAGYYLDNSVHANGVATGGVCTLAGTGSGSGGGSISFVEDNFLGLVDGVTHVFTLSQTAISTQSISVMLNGLVLGASDYTKTTTAVTITTAPASTSGSFFVRYATATIGLQVLSGTNTFTGTNVFNSSTTFNGLTTFGTLFTSSCAAHLTATQATEITNQGVTGSTLTFSCSGSTVWVSYMGSGENDSARTTGWRFLRDGALVDPWIAQTGISLYAMGANAANDISGRVKVPTTPGQHTWALTGASYYLNDNWQIPSDQYTCENGAQFCVECAP